MKLIAILFNFATILISTLWVISSQFDFEPLLALLGSIAALIFTVRPVSDKENSKIEYEKNVKQTNWIVLLILILLAFVAWNGIHKNNIVGIEGDGNQNNIIKINSNENK